MQLTLLQQQIINGYQKGFPVCSQPYQQMANELDTTEQAVLEAITDLNDKDILSRLGPVFVTKKQGQVP